MVLVIHSCLHQHSSVITINGSSVGKKSTEDNDKICHSEATAFQLKYRIITCEIHHEHKSKPAGQKFACNT